MKFSEFKSMDVLNAYYDFISVDDAKYLGYIPENFHDIVDSKCICGSDRMTNASGTVITCCDPRCYIKLGYSLSSMLSLFGAKDIGGETCKSIMYTGIKQGIFTIPSHVEILYKYPEFEYLLGARYEKLVQAVALIQTSSLSFHQIVRAVSIPDFDTSCSTIFADTKNFNDLMNEFRQYGVVNTMANKRVFDLKKCSNLFFFMKDIALFESAFQGQFDLPALKMIKICITGPVHPEGVSMNRTSFIKYCNELSKIGNSRIFEISEGGPATSPYVIADSPSSSAKYTTAKNREYCNPGLKVIYTSTEFVELIRNEVEKCKENMSKS